MNYYIQGDAANADQIKAAFEKLGYVDKYLVFRSTCTLYFTHNDKICNTQTPAFMDIIKTHPDYKELELPVEPKFKFKVGDWIVQNDNGTVSQITKTINGKDEYGEYRAYEHTNGYFAACFENEYHLWTIDDAKDGDVLAAHECYVIFKEIDGLNIKCYCAYRYMGFNPTLYKNTLLNKTVFKPATKEQRDLLFKRIKENGYVWDADKKELCKIQHYDVSNFHAGMPVLVRDSDEHKWLYTLFGIYNKDNSLYPFVVVNMRGYAQCIPFNDKTKHLLGTTDMPSEEYINW